MATQKNWIDLKYIHGNIEGARRGFEASCESIIRLQRKSENVKAIRPDPGDQGIDIYVGDLGVSPIDVYQCKYFLDGLKDSQRQQIRNSYNTAESSNDFVVNKWFLCLPLELNIEDEIWFNQWKNTKKHKIELVSPNELIIQSKLLGIYDLIFDNQDSVKIDAIFQKISNSDVSADAFYSFVDRTENDCLEILLSLIRTHSKCLPKDKYLSLKEYASLAISGDRHSACSYLKTSMALPLSETEKIWVFSILDDFSCEPLGMV